MSNRYCHEPVSSCLKDLKSSLQGLSQVEADNRFSIYGSNELHHDEEEPIYLKFLEQLKQPLIMLLLCSAFISFAIRQYDDAFSITLAVLIVVSVAMVQEYRSEKSLDALKKLVPSYSNVRRDGRKAVRMLSTFLVPGDVVEFTVGDRIPADLRLLSSIDLEIDESMLTGETHAARKDFTFMPDKADVSVAERNNIAFMGTLVRGGKGEGIVIATGVNTEFGLIWSMMKDVSDKKSPLQLKMEELGKKLSFFSLVVISLISMAGILRGMGWHSTFNVAVSLAVAAIPEGLPIVVTVTLALGVLRMSEKKSIVKKLNSVESLGCVSVVCADKTGTLTKNHMTVVGMYTISDGLIDAAGRDEDRLTFFASRPSYFRLLQAGSLCNNAHFREEDSSYIGTSTEIALLEVINKFPIRDQRNLYSRTNEIPFDSTKKWMAVEIDVMDGHLYFAKGAPEVLLSRCTKYYFDEHSTPPFGLSIGSLNNAAKAITPDIIHAIERNVLAFANRSQRVMAAACGTSLNELIFLGLFSILDPPRENVSSTVSLLKRIGVKVIMITGDSGHTAISIAKDVNILDHYISKVNEEAEHRFGISGAEIDNMSQSELSESVKNCVVFYRTTPKHKLMIVKALQENGNVVAMTGDGVNDAPVILYAHHRL